jgi:hypothetical protein
VLLIKLARVIFLYLNHAIHRHADTSCTLAPHIVNAPSLIANNSTCNYKVTVQLRD